MTPTGASAAADPALSATWLLAIAILAIAFLYASVGHGGASGYLAAMALAGVAPMVMRPVALLLNIIVAGLAAVQFARAGWFSWRLFWPFALTSVPFAAIGGAVVLPDELYKRLVGVVLLYAAYRLFRSASHAGEAKPSAGSLLADVRARRNGSGRTGAQRRTSEGTERPPGRLLAGIFGVGLGFLAGVTGVGGGIFLSPLLLEFGWAGARRTAAVSAAFILFNSVAGLSAHLATIGTMPRGVGVWAAAALIGGAAGATLGSRRLAGATIRRLLAFVLFLAAIKFLLLV